MKRSTIAATLALAAASIGLGSNAAHAATCTATSTSIGRGVVSCTAPINSITTVVRVQRQTSPGVWADVTNATRTCWNTASCDLNLSVDSCAGGWWRTITAGSVKATATSAAFSTAPHVIVQPAPSCPSH